MEPQLLDLNNLLFPVFLGVSYCDLFIRPSKDTQRLPTGPRTVFISTSEVSVTSGATVSQNTLKQTQRISHRMWHTRELVLSGGQQGSAADHSCLCVGPVRSLFLLPLDLIQEKPKHI